MPLDRFTRCEVPALRRAVALMCALVGIAPVAAQWQEAGIELPPIPDALLAGTRRPPSDAWGGRVLPVKAPPAATHLEVGPVTVEATLGANLIIEIAIDHLNRILTPFPSPQVRTVSDATTSVDGSVLYVATASETPVTLFVSDAADPNQALSLTLAPRRIPPREIRLELTEPLPARVRGTPPAAPPGAAAPDYVADLTEAMRALAREEIPAGYSLRQAMRSETVTCAQLGVETRRGQVLEGGALWLVTALAWNTTDRPLEIEERACRVEGDGDTVAIAAWPQVWLDPGERVELYVAVRPRTPDQRRPERPSLRRQEAR